MRNPVRVDDFQRRRAVKVVRATRWSTHAPVWVAHTCTVVTWTCDIDNVRKRRVILDLHNPPVTFGKNYWQVLFRALRRTNLPLESWLGTELTGRYETDE